MNKNLVIELIHLAFHQIFQYHYENNQTYFYNVIKKIANENPKLTYKEIMEKTQSDFELGQSGKMMLMIDLRCRE